MILKVLLLGGIALALLIILSACKVSSQNDDEEIREWIRRHSQNERKQKGDQYHEK